MSMKFALRFVIIAGLTCYINCALKYVEGPCSSVSDCLGYDPYLQCIDLKCQPCPLCIGPGTQKISGGTPKEECYAVCETCPEGHFNDGLHYKCMHHSSCGKNENGKKNPVLRQGTADSDTLCGVYDDSRPTVMTPIYDLQTPVINSTMSSSTAKPGDLNMDTFWISFWIVTCISIVAILVLLYVGKKIATCVNNRKNRKVVLPTINNECGKELLKKTRSTDASVSHSQQGLTDSKESNIGSISNKFYESADRLSMAQREDQIEPVPEERIDMNGSTILGTRNRNVFPIKSHDKNLDITGQSTGDPTPASSTPCYASNEAVNLNEAEVVDIVCDGPTDESCASNRQQSTGGAHFYGTVNIGKFTIFD